MEPNYTIKVFDKIDYKYKQTLYTSLRHRNTMISKLSGCFKVFYKYLQKYMKYIQQNI